MGKERRKTRIAAGPSGNSTLERTDRAETFPSLNVGDNKKLDKQDLIIISLLTFLYLCIALFNLGSLNVPKTGWAPTKRGDSFLIDLGMVRDLSRISYYEGSGEGRYRLEYRREDGSYHPLGVINKRNFYKWNYLNVAVKTDRIKVIIDLPGGTLLELGFYERGNRKPIRNPVLVRKPHALSTDSSTVGEVENLFDEEETIVYHPSFMTGTYFDEIYHARTAYEHLNRIEPYETTHPPLGKLLIALGILLFGMNPFGWRIVGALIGTAMIPCMYLFGKKLFGGRFFPFCAALLMTFDFMHFTQTRIATIDVYAVFFILLMYYFFYDYFLASSRLIGFDKSLRPFLWSGLCFGMGAATKWVTLYGGAGLALLVLWAKFTQIFAYYKVSKGKKEQPQKGISISRVKSSWCLSIARVGLYGVLFFLIIPAGIYLLSYLPFMMVPGPGHGFKEVLTYQSHMYNYHSKLLATHPFASSWWEWPLIIRPIWLYGRNDLALGTTSSIVCMGNPAVWWVGVVTIIPTAFLAIRRRDKGMAVVFTAMCFQYLPWILVNRLTFIYHFFSSVPFLILSSVYLGKALTEKYPISRYFIYLYLSVVIILFILFYPVLSGMEVSLAYVEKLKWFKSWIF